MSQKIFPPTPRNEAKKVLKRTSRALDGDLAVPLIVDFDGTMHLSDLTWEGIFWIAKTRPWLLAKLGWIYLRMGKAAMKLRLETLAEDYDWVPVLPWEERVLARVAEEKARGRTVVVVTGSTTRLVKKAVEAKGLDYEVVGTEKAEINLTGPRKAAALIARWGVKNFDYIGNSRDDWAVWKEGRYALVIGNDPRIRAGARKVSEVIWELDTHEAESMRRRLVRRLKVLRA